MNRRDLLKALGLSLAAGLVPGNGSAASADVATPQRPEVRTKVVPRTDQVVPAIGLGTFLTFNLVPGQPRDDLWEVMRRYFAAGGRVIDTSPLYGTAEISVGDFLSAPGQPVEVFLTNKVWSTGEYLADDSHAERSLQQSMQRLWRDRIDLMQCHSLVNVEMLIPLFRAWKKEGRIRYIGVTHHEPAYFDALATKIDCVQIHYSIYNRRAEDRVLRAAAERGVAVFVNMPLEKARLFKIVEGRSLPDFASEIRVEN